MCICSTVIFPKGTTTNGTGMLRFRSGAFSAGLPVRLVLIRYPFERFNPAWESIPLHVHLFRLLTQCVNRAEVTFLPLIVPSDEERLDPKLFSRNVQEVMACVLRQPIYRLNRKHKLEFHKFLLQKQTAEEALAKARRLYDEDATLNA